MNKRIVKRNRDGNIHEFMIVVGYKSHDKLDFGEVEGYYITCIPITTNENGDISNVMSDCAHTQLLFKSESDEESDRFALELSKSYEEDVILEVEQKIEEKAIQQESSEFILNKRIEELKKHEESLIAKENKKERKRKTELKEREELALEKKKRNLERCKYYTKPSDVTFDSIAGLESVKEEIRESIDLLKNKEEYKAMGVDSKLNNILLSGASGCGKTMLVKAMSNELGYPLFQASGEFADRYVGTASKNIEELFEEARKYAPSIVFIDEAEQVARARTGESTNSERESGTAKLLAQLDGFETTDNVLVVLATNLPNTMDKAVLRRMTKKIHISDPDYKTRLGILEINAKNKKLDENVDLKKIARNLSGFNGGTIANIMNTAGIFAVRKGLKKITQTEIEEAFERETCGLASKSKRLGEEEKRLVAYHECGHALIGYILGGEKIQKISIIPRMDSTLGYVLSANEDDDDKFLSTKEEMINRIVKLLGGRGAEELVFGKVTGGASNDLEKATKIAENMVCRLGMSDSFGLVSIDPKEIFMREKVLSEVKTILEECYCKSMKILNQNKSLLDRLADILIEKEEMTYEDFVEAIGESISIEG